MYPNNMPALEKSKVTRKKKSHSNENVIYKPTEKHKPEPEPTLTISAYEIEQLRKSEAKMLHRLNHLRKRVKHFEKRFQSMPKPGITHNKSCEAIGLYDTAVQTCAQKSGKFKEYCEETENLKSVIEKLNLKIVELTEISKVNQLVNVDSNSASTLQNVEFSRCLNHLEKRMDRLSELVQNKRTPCMRLMSNFALTEFGNGDQLQTNPVEQLFLRSTEKFGQKYKKLQSIVIVNEPIYPEPNKKITKSNRSVKLQTSDSVGSVHNVKKKKKKKCTCCGCFSYKNKSDKEYCFYFF